MLLQWLLHLHPSFCSLCDNMRMWVSSKLTLQILCEKHCVPQHSLFCTDTVWSITYAYAATCMLICSRKWDLQHLCCFAVTNICLPKYQCGIENPKNLNRACKKENKNKTTFVVDVDMKKKYLRCWLNNNSHKQILLDKIAQHFKSTVLFDNTDCCLRVCRKHLW